MEQILWLYEQVYDPEYPLICFDERPYRLQEDTLQPLAMKQDKPKRENYEYKRKGTCCLLVAFQPLQGKRIVEVSERRTKQDYTRFFLKLSEQYPKAKKIRLIQDNLNTHNASSFYEVLVPEKAFELMQRFEFFYTPKKASWLNMVEIELSIIARTCLKRRIPTMEIMQREVGQLVKERNQVNASVNWQFSNIKAREKMSRHYQLVSTST